ncbi:uncharacterized protein LACBIDRAFT_333161 [Laccaria bicolor S238N-H82]|uniref:Predicted protein n=1 Tax=Laccaria bicolor (strain S238N-H82 / ATCC MYA-4686) TaxID=486041 RepID=B0DV30_LACBS|nr:uncharacterized protein LACBIDRAFT_333161 [Laccaria bicolor S238N-H82]EDR01505.1 predicted protein [Laccaria bicolor S238N-H82]|eukprot:XP_001887857.1 predicted protein [Laccaria bicolor S238N-H82]
MQITETGEVPDQPDPTFIAKVERRCEAAGEWISRSGECPISISVCNPTHVYDRGSETSKMYTSEVAIAQILASSRRWKKVIFRATDDSFTRLQQLAEDDVPLLESLVIAGGTLTIAWDSPASNADIPLLTRDELICFLESVPLLIHLRITNYSGPPSVVDDEVIDCLTPSGEKADCLCPMLEAFQCMGSDCVSFSEAQLLSLVQERSKSEKVGVLEQVYVSFGRREPKKFDEFLDSLTGTGMKVSQRYTTGAIILPESNNTKLSTVVNINHAEWPARGDYFYPLDGLDLEGCSSAYSPHFGFDY